MKKPRVDLGYPTPARGNIPSFRTVEEEATFWDSHDVTDFLENEATSTVTVTRELGDRLTVRLDRADRSELDRHARAMGVGPSTLIRIWLKERLRQEAS